MHSKYQILDYAVYATYASEQLSKMDVRNVNVLFIIDILWVFSINCIVHIQAFAKQGKYNTWFYNVLDLSQ